MRLPSIALSLSLFFLMSIPDTHAEVTVNFVQPEGYTDAGGYGRDAERNLRDLERHLKTQGARCVIAGATLELTVLDVDLAGHNEWWHPGAYDFRVMRDITWPRLDLSFVFRDAAGKVRDEGRERISDLSYLWRSGQVLTDTEALPYEKAMLRDWFDRNFCRAGHAQRTEEPERGG